MTLNLDLFQLAGLLLIAFGLGMFTGRTWKEPTR